MGLQRHPALCFDSRMCVAHRCGNPLTDFAKLRSHLFPVIGPEFSELALGVLVSEGSGQEDRRSHALIEKRSGGADVVGGIFEIARRQHDRMTAIGVERDDGFAIGTVDAQHG